MTTLKSSSYLDIAVRSVALTIGDSVNTINLQMSSPVKAKVKPIQSVFSISHLSGVIVTNERKDGRHQVLSKTSFNPISFAHLSFNLTNLNGDHLLNNEIFRILLLFANLVISLSYSTQKYCLRNSDGN